MILYFGIIVSVIFSVICFIFTPQIARMLKADGELLEHCIVYGRILFATQTAFILQNMFQSFLVAAEEPVLSLKSNIAAGLTNGVFDYLFIAVFEWGVAGAAISTLVSRAFCAIVVLYFLRKPKQKIVLNQYHTIRPDFPLIGKVLAIGIPAGVENGMFQFGKLAIQSTVSTLGTQAIAAQAMTVIFENVNGIAAIAVGIGLMTVAGQAFGAGRKEEAKYYIIKLTGYAEIVLIISCAVTFLICRPIMHLPGMEAESMELCYQMLIAITIAKPILWALSFIPPYGLRAAGDVKFSMITATCTMWFCRVALAVYLIRFQGFGPIAVWIGMFADWGIRSIIFSIRFLSGKWMEKHVI